MERLWKDSVTGRHVGGRKVRPNWTITRCHQAKTIGGRRVGNFGSSPFFFLSFLSLGFELFFSKFLEEFSGTSVMVEGQRSLFEETIVEDDTKDAASDELEWDCMMEKGRFLITRLSVFIPGACAAFGYHSLLGCAS